MTPGWRFRCRGLTCPGAWTKLPGCLPRRARGCWEAPGRLVGEALEAMPLTRARFVPLIAVAILLLTVVYVPAGRLAVRESYGGAAVRLEPVVQVGRLAAV